MNRFRRMLVLVLLISSIAVVVTHGFLSAYANRKSTLQNASVSSTIHTWPKSAKLSISRSEGKHVIKYRIYRNRGYGFSVEIPLNWIESSRPTDGDGRLFYDPIMITGFTNDLSSSPYSHNPYIAVLGGVNAASVDLSMIEKEAKTDQKHYGKNLIEYKYGILKGWVWVIKYVNTGGGAASYDKAWIDGTVIEQFNVVFPRSQYGYFSKIIHHIDNSFAPADRIIKH